MNNCFVKQVMLPAVLSMVKRMSRGQFVARYTFRVSIHIYAGIVSQKQRLFIVSNYQVVIQILTRDITPKFNQILKFFCKDYVV